MSISTSFWGLLFLNILLVCNVFSESCTHTYVESIPENLTLTKGSPTHDSIYHGWLNLLNIANETIEIASSYWSLRNSDISTSDPSSWEGEIIFDELMKAGLSRGIEVRIVHSDPTSSQPDNDTIILANTGAAQVRILNMSRLLGSGILHSKMWLVDRRHFYLGSANMDWRSLTQVKELGVVVYNCPELAKDMGKVFDAYWQLGTDNSSIPHPWPRSFATSYNASHPLHINFNDSSANVYISSSPPPFCADGRQGDIDAILGVIAGARKYVDISVMDYSPASVYLPHNIYWPFIDDAIRAAAFDRGIHVRLLVATWAHSLDHMEDFLRSLHAVSRTGKGSIDVKLFRVPCYSEEQCSIPYARVDHCKFMVTDSTAYIGTSNWTPDYFITTGGIGLIVNNSYGTIQSQLAAVFERDWFSEYASIL